eukprot:1420980-Amphidinium_carterae.1
MINVRNEIQNKVKATWPHTLKGCQEYKPVTVSNLTPRGTNFLTKLRGTNVLTKLRGTNVLTKLRGNKVLYFTRASSEYSHAQNFWSVSFSRGFTTVTS